jgi:hypothetical protein
VSGSRGASSPLTHPNAPGPHSDGHVQHLVPSSLQCNLFISMDTDIDAKRVSLLDLVREHQQGTHPNCIVARLTVVASATNIIQKTKASELFGK